MVKTTHLKLRYLSRSRGFTLLLNCVTLRKLLNISRSFDFHVCSLPMLQGVYHHDIRYSLWEQTYHYSIYDCSDPLRISGHTSNNHYMRTILGLLETTIWIYTQDKSDWEVIEVQSTDLQQCLADVRLCIFLLPFISATIHLRHVFRITSQSGPAGLVHVTGCIVDSLCLHSLLHTTFFSLSPANVYVDQPSKYTIS